MTALAGIPAQQNNPRVDSVFYPRVVFSCFHFSCPFLSLLTLGFNVHDVHGISLISLKLWFSRKVPATLYHSKSCSIYWGDCFAVTICMFPLFSRYVSVPKMYCWWNSLWLAWKLAQAAQQPWSGRRLWSCTGAWKSRAELPSSSTQFLHVSSWCSATSGCSWHVADTPPLEGLLILKCVIYDPLEGSQIWKMKAAKMGVQDLIFAFVNILHMLSYVHQWVRGGGD